jgi:hypothetical protein
VARLARHVDAHFWGASDDKKCARIQILSTIVERLEEAL